MLLVFIYKIPYGEVNNTDILIIMGPVSGWEVLGSK